MMSGSSQLERLARIEALLERMSDSQAKGHEALAKDIAALKADLSADKADLAALKNRGVGFIIGIGIVAAALGAKINAVFSAVASAFK